MKIAVIGAGFFGCISAKKLAQAGHEVVIYEEKSAILQCASGINQYRLHSGYHYPRSVGTIDQSILGLSSFKEEYGDCLKDGISNFYGISKKDSLISGKDYLSLLDEVGLEYEIIDSPLINSDMVELQVKVKERLIDKSKILSQIWLELSLLEIEGKFNCKFEPEMIQDYDLVINSTYSNLNYLLSTSERIDYQFEICEKPVVKLPVSYENQSVVILDGPFMCLDPFQSDNHGRQLHLLGHVDCAIHSRNIGHFAEIPRSYERILNNGILDPDYVPSRFNEFKNEGKKFFSGFKPKHIGSMFTIRTVQPKREYDDGRPSYISKNGKIYSIFSGKIGTAVDIANKLVKMISE